MYQHRLVLHRIAQRGIDGVPHPCGHGARHLQILGGHRSPLLIVGQHDPPDALPQILQIPRHGQNGHQLRADGDVGAGVHGIAVHLPLTQADAHFPQRLTAKIQHEAPLHPRRVDIQPPQPASGQRLVVIVALMLHPGVQRGHGQIVCVHDVVDVPRQSQRELGHGDQQRVAAAGGGALHVHGGAAGGLPQAAAYVGAQPSQALDQSQRRGGFPLAQRRGRDGCHLDIFPIRPVLQPLHNAQEVQLGRLAVGQQLAGQQSQLFPEVLHTGQGTLRRRADLPVLIDGGVEHRPACAVRISAVFKCKCHAAPSLLCCHISWCLSGIIIHHAVVGSQQHSDISVQ